MIEARSLKNISDLEVEGGFRFSLDGQGLSSKRLIQTTVCEAKPRSGITFVIQKDPQEPVSIKAVYGNVVNTLRNVTLGAEGVRLCIVEHLLAAVSLWGLEDLVVYVDGPELPLGDGSAEIWVTALKKANIAPRSCPCDVEIKAPITINKGDRTLLVMPDEKFSVTYLMDWNHPLIGKKWQTWNPDLGIEELYICRTFGSMKEHQLLGLENDVVSMTDDGFSKELHYSDEPVRHKLLDLIGDLALIGFNPLRLKGRFISIKAGHEMDVQLVKSLVL